MRRSILTSLAALALVACGGPPSMPDVATDAGDESIADALATDVSYPACSVPFATLPTGAAARALAQSPARCGQPAYSWVGDSHLGHVTARGEHFTYSAATLRALGGAASAAVSAMVRNSVDGDVFTYTTQDRGSLTEASAFIAYPSGVTTATTRDVLLFLHGTQGFSDGCAPSADSASRSLAALFAGMGYIVIAPDYLGMKSMGAPSTSPHPYLLGQPTAIASLDSVRAAIRFMADLDGPQCASTRYAAFGISQGGHAALWIDRLAPYYLPEATLVGVVASVPPANLTEEATLALRSDIGATSNIAAFYGVAPAWYGLSSRLGEVFLPPYDAQIPTALQTACGTGAANVSSLDAGFTQTILTAAQNDQLAALDPWGCVVNESSLVGTSIARIAPTTPGYGVLYVLGGADQLVSTPTERQSFQTLCANGMQMQYLECNGAGHIETTLWGMSEILAFIGARFAGEPMRDVCPPAPSGTRCSGTP